MHFDMSTYELSKIFFSHQNSQFITWHLKCAYSPGTTVWFIIVFWIFGGPHVSTANHCDDAEDDDEGEDDEGEGVDEEDNDEGDDEEDDEEYVE